MRQHTLVTGRDQPGTCTRRRHIPPRTPYSPRSPPVSRHQQPVQQSLSGALCKVLQRFARVHWRHDSNVFAVWKLPRGYRRHTGARRHLVYDGEAVRVDGAQADVGRGAGVEADIVQRICVHHLGVPRQQVCSADESTQQLCSSQNGEPLRRHQLQRGLLKLRASAFGCRCWSVVSNS